MTELSIWQLIVSQVSALILGAVGGGCASAIVTWRMLRASTARQLVADTLAIQAEKEAWIVEGPNYSSSTLSVQHPSADSGNKAGLRLRRVELRAALDEAVWNAPEDQFYDVMLGRRTWIVRDKVTGQTAYSGALRGGWHPAIASSRALEELCAWIHQVALARRGRLLWQKDLDLLKPHLVALCTPDRINVLQKWLSPEGRTFLEQYAKTVNRKAS